MKPLTAKEAILLAAYQISQRGRKPMTLSELVIAAWKTDTIRFGMRGYESLYPDSHRVSVELASGKMIDRERLLRRIGRNLYRMTAAGIRFVHDCQAAQQRMAQERERQDAQRRLEEAREIERQWPSYV